MFRMMVLFIDVSYTLNRRCVSMDSAVEKAAREIIDHDSDRKVSMTAYPPLKKILAVYSFYNAWRCTMDPVLSMLRKDSKGRDRRRRSKKSPPISNPPPLLNIPITA